MSVPNQDLLLAQVVSATAGEDGHRVVLLSGGTVIAGTLISAQAFEARISRLVSDALVAAGRDATGLLADQQQRSAALDTLEMQRRDHFQEVLAKSAGTALLTAQQRDDLEDASVHYLHLRDAQIGVGAAGRGMALPLWRMRQSEVSGWMYGVPEG